MTEYFTRPIGPMPNFTFDNVYATENIMIFGGTNLPAGRSSRNTLILNGNLRARKDVKLVSTNFTEYGPNDLFFNGNIYVAGDVMAEMLTAFGDEE